MAMIDMHSMTKAEYAKLLEDLVIRKHQVLMLKKMLLNIFDKLLTELPPENDIWAYILQCIVTVFDIQQPYTTENIMEVIAKARMELKDDILD